MPSSFISTSVSTLFAIIAISLTGCEQNGDGEPAENDADAGQANADGGTNANAEVSADVRHARSLWDRIENYADWPQPEGFAGWQEGTSPHGSVLRYYVNDAAQENLTQDGAVIVKENYSEESEDELLSVTIMEKRAGYDPETENWFYVKYAPDGSIMDNPQGQDLAGLVGKGASAGCIPCHATAGGGDYLFMND